MILQVEAGLAALAPALESREVIRVTARFEEKAFAFSQTNEIDARFEEVATPGVRKVALDAQSKAGARSIRKRRDGIGGGQNVVRAVAFVKRRVQQGFRRKCVGPSEDGGGWGRVALRVAANCLIIRDIRLLKIGAGTHEQQSNGVIVSCAPVEL